jgi:hypothetical protein
MQNLPINIDITEFSSLNKISQKESQDLIDSILKAIATQFRYEWVEAAKNELHSTRQAYINAIYVEDNSPTLKTVGLRPGFLVNGVELGLDAFDMKLGFSKSSKVKLKASGGWYITVPFSFATSGAIGDSEVFSNKMPEEIHAAVKKSAAEGKKQLGFGDIPKQFQIPQIRERITLPNRTFEEYVHKSPIYEGIQKSNKPNHSGYVSFRRVSDLSDDNSWIHSGIQAHNLCDKALSKMDGSVIEDLVANRTDAFLESL